MSLAVVYSRASLGVDAPLVSVEVHLSNGLPAFNIVGLPEASVKESRDRVRSALINGNFEFPAKRITVNLAPADLPKEGGRFDLAIALGILAASEQIPDNLLADYEFLGELVRISAIAIACFGIIRSLLFLAYSFTLTDRNPLFFSLIHPLIRSDGCCEPIDPVTHPLPSDFRSCCTIH